MKGFNWLISLLYVHTAKKSVINEPADVYWPVGYANQQHGNLCGDASISMLNHFYKKEYSSLEVNPRSPIEGKSDSSFPPQYTNFYISTKEDIKKRLDEGPLITGIPMKANLGHYITVIGYREADNNELIIFYHDPLTGSNKNTSFDQLIRLNDPYGFSGLQITSADQVSTRKQTVVSQRENIMPKHYGKFFSINAMEKPVDAFKNLLMDYATNKKWYHFRHHRAEIINFLNIDEVVKVNSNDSESFAKLFNEAFPALNKGELFQRSQTGMKFLNIKQNLRETIKNNRDDTDNNAQDNPILK